MSKIQHVYGLFEDKNEALAAYKEVRDRGCSDESCSAIMHERHIDESRLPSGERAAKEGAVAGAAVAGSLGVALGGLAALGGGILGVGPLAAAALGGGAMAVYGGLIGGISGSDEPEKHLRVLAEGVEAGEVLIAVETDDPMMEAMCAEIFTKHGGRQIAF